MATTNLVRIPRTDVTGVFTSKNADRWRLERHMFSCLPGCYVVRLDILLWADKLIF